MPGFLQVILNIVLFLVSLSVLIMVHELGHLSAAKFFKIYCADYSIGFGKAFLHKKRKNGETYFSLRVFPFGGFVQIVDQEGEIAPGLFVPKERTLNGQKKYKEAIVMASGVIMNFVLALFLLYFSNQFFERKHVILSGVDVKENSIADNANIHSTSLDKDHYVSGDLLCYFLDERNANEGSRVFYIGVDGVATFEDGSTIEIISILKETRIDSFRSYSYDEIIEHFGCLQSNVANYEKAITPDFKNGESELKCISFNPYFYTKKVNSVFCLHCLENFDVSDKVVDEKGIQHCPICHHEVDVEKGINCILNAEGRQVYMVLNVIKENNQKRFESIGLSTSYSHYHQNFKDAWSSTFSDYGNGAVMIFKGLGSLFTGQGWAQTGGIIAVYKSSSTVLSSMGFGYFLRYWGLISINLGIFNLLPFPGLDGWHLLVIAVEGTTKKKIPEKVKSIISYIGLGLLLLLAVVLVVKDIILF